MSTQTSNAGGNRLVDLLSPLGLLVVIGAYAWQSTGRPLPGQMRWYLGAALALVAVHVVLRFDAVVDRVGRRQVAHGSNSAVLTLAVIAIVVGINVGLGYRTGLRWDLTKNQRHSLSDQASKVLRELKDDVRVLYFTRKDEMAAGQERMKLYQGVSPRLTVEFVDALRNPARAEEYDARGPYPVLILERGERRERLTNDTEQDFANALVKVTRDQVKTICFLEGEGQRNIEDAEGRGYSRVNAALTSGHYKTQKVVLLQEGRVPEACTVVVLAAPQKDLVAPLVEALRTYVQQGGKLFVLLEPPFKGDTDAVNALLAEWNIQVAKDVVVDLNPAGQLVNAGPLSPLAMEYPNHPITKDMKGLATVFPAARSVKATGGQATNLAETTAASWAETDLTLAEPVQRNENDQPGPISLAAVTTVPVASAPSPEPSPAASPAPDGAPAPAPEPTREGRVVVIGDSDFAANAMLDVQGNKDLFLNAVSWLAEDADLLTIRPRDPDEQRLLMNQQDLNHVVLATLLGLPGLIVAAGVFSWWRRR